MFEEIWSLKRCTTPVCMVEASGDIGATIRRTQEYGCTSGSYDVVAAHWQREHAKKVRIGARVGALLSGAFSVVRSIRPSLLEF